MAQDHKTRMLRGHASLQMILGMAQDLPSRSKRKKARLDPSMEVEERRGAERRTNTCFETWLVGRRWHDEERAFEGDFVTLQRERDNPKDRNAIRVLKSETSKVLGYIPARVAEWLSPLLDEEQIRLNVHPLKEGDPKEAGKPLQLILDVEFLGTDWDTQRIDALLEKLRNANGNLHGQRPAGINIKRTAEIFHIFLDTINSADLQLLSEEERRVHLALLDLPVTPTALLAKLLSRRSTWFRVEKLNYVESDIQDQALNVLLEKSLIERFDVRDDQILHQILNLLTVQELKDLFVGLGLVSSRGANKLNKKELVETPFKNTKNLRLFGGNSSCELDRVFGILNEKTGPWIRVSEIATTAVRRMQFLSFLEFESGLSKFLLEDLGIVRYPSYTVKKNCSVFSSRAKMLEYEVAVSHAKKIDLLLSNGELDRALEEMKPSLDDLESGHVRRSALAIQEAKGYPLYLSRYSAAWVHAAIGNVAVSVLESKKEYRQANEILRQLLGTICFTGKRGSWWQRLCINLEHLKKVNESLETAEAALADEHVRCGDRIAIQKRVLRLGKPPRRWKKPSWACSLPGEPNQVRIFRTPFEKKIGQKNLFDGFDGKPCTVEQLALQWYSHLENGGWMGVHDEGSRIRSIFVLLFWDIIFHDKVEGVFRSRFQTMPLDWNTEAFYLSRKNLIEERIGKIGSSRVEDLSMQMETCWDDNHGSFCQGIDWDAADLEQLKSIASCLSTRGLAGICRCFAEDHAGWSSGMPDLLLWDPKTGSSRMVEVKGPRDRLSEQQRAWMAFLSSQGIHVEVFKVEERGSPVDP